MVGAGEFEDVAGVGEACNPLQAVARLPEGLPGGDSSSACCFLLSCEEAGAEELAGAVEDVAFDVSSSSFSCVAVVCVSVGGLQATS